MKNLSELLKFNEEFLIYDNGESQIQASEFDILTKRIALGLSSSSLDVNSTVLYYLPNRLHFLFSWALIRMGVRNGSYNLAAERLDLGKVTIITPYKEFDRSRHETLVMGQKVLYEITQLNEDEYQGDRIDQAEIITFSSGSTGEPKAIQFQIGELYQRAQVAASNLWTKKTPYMSLLGSSSIPGLSTQFWNMANRQTYLAPSTPEKNLRLINKHQVKAIQASPNQLSELAEYGKESHKSMPSVEVVTIAGGFSTPELLKRFDDSIEFWNYYASSEAGPAAIKKNYSGEFGNVGKVVSGTQLEIVDENNKPVQKGDTGQIRVKRDGMVRSYLGANSDSFKDGWFYPGDTGYIDDQGDLILVGRSNETENVGGLKLNINDVDQKLSDIHIVKEIAGFFYEDENGMKKLGVACVPARDFDLPKLMLEMRWRLGEKTPKFVMEVSALPRSESGKLLREKLSEKAKGQD